VTLSSGADAITNEMRDLIQNEWAVSRLLCCSTRAAAKQRERETKSMTFPTTPKKLSSIPAICANVLPGSASAVSGTSMAGKNASQLQPWISPAMRLRSTRAAGDQKSQRTEQRQQTDGDHESSLKICVLFQSAIFEPSKYPPA
jgi:hypothetical protein